MVNSLLVDTCPQYHEYHSLLRPINLEKKLNGGLFKRAKTRVVVYQNNLDITIKISQVFITKSQYKGLQDENHFPCPIFITAPGLNKIPSYSMDNKIIRLNQMTQ